MAHFAKVEDGVVTQIIVADQDFIDSGIVGDPLQWIQTSYNTKGNIHYGSNGEPDGGIPLRANFAGINYFYDSVNDVFYSPKPFTSWTLNTTTWLWEAPIPKPNDGKFYTWDEANQTWIEVTV